MRIAVSSAPFRRSFASGGLTQLEWVERCAAVLAVDGVFPAAADFPRRDDDYVAQLRKVAIDLGVVPLGIDAPGLLAEPPAEREAVLGLARTFGAALVRITLPPPGDVPPATFVETTGAAKALSRLAKSLNVTLIAAAAPGSLAEDLAGVKHLLKDVDSAWLRAAPRAVETVGAGPKDRYPAVTAVAGEDLSRVGAAARARWVLLDAPGAEEPWETLGGAIRALREVDETAAAVRHPV